MILKSENKNLSRISVLSKSLAIACMMLLAWLNAFAQTKQLAELKRTDFVPTLEHKFKRDRNAIYAASLLYSWEEAKRNLKCNVSVQQQPRYFVLFDKSTSHRNTLRPDEIESNVSIEQNIIEVSARFQKSLPFQEPMLAGQGLKFNGEGVSSFEWVGKARKSLEILQYDNDSNFVVKLIPRDSTHEIILAMTGNPHTNMSTLVQEVNQKIELGMLEKRNSELTSKYVFTEFDFIDIPEIGFDLEGRYSELEEKFVVCNNERIYLGRAAQKIAFFLNQKGAEIDTEGISQVVFAIPVEAIDFKPKNMRVNKPFFIMLRKAHTTNPYFAMWVANTELMTKE